MLKQLVLEYAASGTHIGGLRIIEIILLARNNELAARLYATNTNSLSLPSTRAPLAPQQRHGKHGPRATKFSNLPETWSLRNRAKQTKKTTLERTRRQTAYPSLPSTAAMQWQTLYPPPQQPPLPTPPLRFRAASMAAKSSARGGPHCLRVRFHASAWSCTALALETQKTAHSSLEAALAKRHILRAAQVQC